MRVSLVYTGLLISTLSTLLADPAKGQGIDEIYVTIELKDESLKDLFKKIEKGTGLLFTYNEDQIKGLGTISFAASRRSVKEVLDIAFEGTPLKYAQVDSHVITVYRIESKDISSVSGRSLAPGNPNEQNQLYPISGIVRDAETQETIPGVSILVKGTTTGTTTDKDGKYTVNANEGDILVFTAVGWKPVEVSVGDRTVIDIGLEADITTLDEVEINAGYWNVKEREKTGNISRVSAEEIQRQPVSNPLSALQGRMPGVYISQTSGVPGGGFNIQIRGRNSLRLNGNDPLYIIDGVPFTSTSLSSPSVGGSVISGANPLNSLNPSDISSIEVLKDADATAIYGSRGANGVVLITTKKGVDGKTKVDINIYSGVGKVTNKLDLLNTEQYLEMRNEAFQNDGATPQSFDYDVNGTWDLNRYTDWQRLLIGGTAKISSAQASISGGTERTQFIFGGSYLSQTTVFPGDFRDTKGGAHFNLSHTSTDNKLRMTFSSNYSIDQNSLPMVDPTRDIALPPNAPHLHDENGNLNWQNSTWNNPLASLKRPYFGKTNNLVSNVTFRYEIAKGLSLGSNLGYTNIRLEEMALIPIASQNRAQSQIGASFFGSNAIETWIVEPQAEYNRNIGKGRLIILVGSTFQQNLQKTQNLTGIGYTNDALLRNIQFAPTKGISDVKEVEYRYNAVFGRVNYNWDSKYLLNLTARRDGSSRFGPNNQFANFGAFGVAWIFTNESFASKYLPFLSFGKIRSSYGITGSDQIGDYEYLDTYSATPYPYQGGVGLQPTRLVNPDYSWESNRKFEGGLELGLIKDRISFSTSWYRNYSTNQLVGYALPDMSGFSSVQYNLPAEIRNTGWEFELESVNLNLAKFRWTTSFNLSAPQNKLLAFPNIKGSSYANLYDIGKSLYTKKTYDNTGIDTETGIYTFLDVNGDNSLTSDDKQFLKEVKQHFYGGLQSNFKYLGFELDILFQFVKQTGENPLAGGLFGAPGFYGNQPVDVMRRWRQPGDISDIQKFTQKSGPVRDANSNNSNGNSDNFVDSSFARLKNVSLSWQFPVRWVQKAKLQAARVYFQGQNLFTITNYRGLDPETMNRSGLPTLRMLTTGFQLSL